MDESVPAGFSLRVGTWEKVEELAVVVKDIDADITEEDDNVV